MARLPFASPRIPERMPARTHPLRSLGDAFPRRQQPPCSQTRLRGSQVELPRPTPYDLLRRACVPKAGSLAPPLRAILAASIGPYVRMSPRCTSPLKGPCEKEKSCKSHRQTAKIGSRGSGWVSSGNDLDAVVLPDHALPQLLDRHDSGVLPQRPHDPLRALEGLLGGGRGVGNHAPGWATRNVGEGRGRGA